MKINLVANSTSSEESQKLVYWLASEMAKEYHIATRGIMYFVHDGSKQLCNWIEKTHGIRVSRFMFKDDTETYGAGFDFEDGPNLTALLLKVPNGPLKLGR